MRASAFYWRAIAAGSLLMPACTAWGTPGPADAARSMEVAVDAYLEPLVRDDLISGAVLIAREGEIKVAKGYGLANREWGEPNGPSTAFRLGSLTKQFTASAILLLEQDGLLGTDDPLVLFYPGFPYAKSITLHHLLTHTSGIPNFSSRPDYGAVVRDPQSIDEMINWFQPDSLLSQPGEAFAYANSNYVILAGVIEKVSGMPYDKFLHERIFGPLGMNGTGQDSYDKVVPHRASGFVSMGPDVEHAQYRDMPSMSGAGSLYSTAEDLFLWDQALYSDRILSAASKEKMFTVHAGNYGYGWFVEDRGGHRVVSHRGEINGFIVGMDRYIDDHILVVSLYNYESVFARRAIRGLCDLALGNEPQPFFVTDPPAIPADVLASYAGEYCVAGGDTIAVVIEEGDLFLMDTEREEKLSTVPQSESLFWVRGLNSMVKFQREPSGVVGRLLLLNSVHTIPAGRI